MERLEDGLDRCWTPGELRKPIEKDHDLGDQRTERHAWGESAARSLLDPGFVRKARDRLVYVLRKVEKI